MPLRKLQSNKDLNDLEKELERREELYLLELYEICNSIDKDASPLSLMIDNKFKIVNLFTYATQKVNLSIGTETFNRGLIKSLIRNKISDLRKHLINRCLIYFDEDSLRISISHPKDLVMLVTELGSSIDNSTWRFRGFNTSVVQSGINNSVTISHSSTKPKSEN